jgi:hypothetical protein
MDKNKEIRVGNIGRSWVAWLLLEALSGLRNSTELTYNGTDRCHQFLGHVIMFRT